MPDAPAPKNTLYERRTRSSRRLTPLRRLPIAIVLVRFWWLACRIVRIVGEEHVAAALASGPVVPVLWHQHQLFCARFLLAQRDRGLVPGFLISPSVDGELPAMVARHSGVHVLRGSSSSDGARVLRDYLMALKQGVSPVINPDGPFGPRFEFKPGPILAAQLSGRPLLPLAYHAQRVYLFRTWDRFVLPWPFARVVVAVGAPRYVPKGLDADALQRWQLEMAAELHAVYRTAREALASA